MAFGWWLLARNYHPRLEVAGRGMGHGRRDPAQAWVMTRALDVRDLIAVGGHIAEILSC